MVALLGVIRMVLTLDLASDILQSALYLIILLSAPIGGNINELLLLVSGMYFKLA
jgi:hypothetical protein